MCLCLCVCVCVCVCVCNWPTLLRLANSIRCDDSQHGSESSTEVNCRLIVSVSGIAVWLVARAIVFRRRDNKTSAPLGIFFVCDLRKSDWRVAVHLNYSWTKSSRLRNNRRIILLKVVVCVGRDNNTTSPIL